MTDDGIGRFAKKFRNEAAATLVQIIRDERASPTARASAARDILSYSDGRPGTAQPVTTVADLALLTPDQRYALFQGLIRYYAEDIGLDQMITQVVDELERRTAQPKISFTRRNPVPGLPPAPAVAGNGAPGAATHGEGSESISICEERGNALHASGRRASGDPGFSPDMEASHRRSEKLAALSASYLRRPPLQEVQPPTPVLAADSSDGYAHALRLSRLSASELEARYYGRFTSQDTDPSIWRGRGKR